MIRKLLLLFLIMSLLVFGCSKAMETTLPPQESSIFRKGDIEKVEVLSESAYIRNGNSEDYPVVTTVSKGLTLDVAGQVGDWYIIVLDDGRVGVINPKEVKPVVVEDGAPDDNIKDLTPNEKEVLRLLNGERTKRGLSPLKIDLRVTEVARFKCQDMIDNDYFSHFSPTYGSPFDMLNAFGIKYIYAGENIAGNTDIREAHKALMNSQGHKENILNENYTHVGIGVKENSKYGKIITQIFISK